MLVLSSVVIFITVFSILITYFIKKELDLFFTFTFSCVAFLFISLPFLISYNYQISINENLFIKDEIAIELGGGDYIVVESKDNTGNEIPSSKKYNVIDKEGKRHVVIFSDKDEFIFLIDDEYISTENRPLKVDIMDVSFRNIFRF